LSIVHVMTCSPADVSQTADPDALNVQAKAPGAKHSAATIASVAARQSFLNPISLSLIRSD
jgi:hypothetical protein